MLPLLYTMTTSVFVPAREFSNDLDTFDKMEDQNVPYSNILMPHPINSKGVYDDTIS